MLDVLPASGVVAERHWPSRLASLALHGAVVAAAIAATQRAPAAPPGTLRDTTIIWDLPAAPSPAPGPSPWVASAATVPLLFQLPSTLPDPGLVTPALPAPTLIDDPPACLSRAPLACALASDSGTATPVGRPGLPLDARLVDEPPLLLEHPPLRYPEVLRQAGIGARVLVEAVLDTTGRVEAASLRVTTPAHELFEAEARSIVAASRYRPGRVDGRAVRVRIAVPVTFALR